MSFYDKCVFPRKYGRKHTLALQKSFHVADASFHQSRIEFDRFRAEPSENISRNVIDSRVGSPAAQRIEVHTPLHTEKCSVGVLLYQIVEVRSVD